MELKIDTKEKYQLLTPAGATITAIIAAEIVTVCNKCLESPLKNMVLNLENVEEIAAVSGVDVILIGTNDLCMEMGIPGEYSNPKVKEAYTKVIKACEKYNKTPGMGGVYDEELMSEYIGMGMKIYYRYIHIYTIIILVINSQE